MYHTIIASEATYNNKNTSPIKKLRQRPFPDSVVILNKGRGKSTDRSIAYKYEISGSLCLCINKVFRELLIRYDGVGSQHTV